MKMRDLFVRAQGLLSDNAIKKLGVNDLYKEMAPFDKMGVKSSRKTVYTLKEFVKDEEDRYGKAEAKFKDLMDKSGGKVEIER